VWFDFDLIWNFIIWFEIIPNHKKIRCYVVQCHCERQTTILCIEVIGIMPISISNWICPSLTDMNMHSGFCFAQNSECMQSSCDFCKIRLYKLNSFKKLQVSVKMICDLIWFWASSDLWFEDLICDLIGDLRHGFKSFFQMICDLDLWFDLWFAHHCYLDHVKKSFYRFANSIFGKVGRTASEEVVLQTTKCIPLLLCGFEVGCQLLILQ